MLCKREVIFLSNPLLLSKNLEKTAFNIEPCLELYSIGWRFDTNMGMDSPQQVSLI